MVIVEVRMLPGEAGAATKFLQSKIPSGIKVDGSKIEIEDEKAEMSSCFFTSSYIMKVSTVTGFSARPGPRSGSFRMTIPLRGRLSDRVSRRGSGLGRIF
ncbi:MAG: hypothetical protein AUI97_04620 [Crenarchaeota archaeon 13_1_40CM_3_52_17]|nr:MAG: hypothetical protein AUI97_04620 [Crenarchaeota archaeon 13_1_40CM_3_52_17]